MRRTALKQIVDDIVRSCPARGSGQEKPTAADKHYVEGQAYWQLLYNHLAHGVRGGNAHRCKHLPAIRLGDSMIGEFLG